MEINPFAPTSAGADLRREVGRADLSIAYWAGLTVLLFVCFVMILGGVSLGWPTPSLGWPGIVTTIAAARVPLLQRQNLACTFLAVYPMHSRSCSLRGR